MRVKHKSDGAAFTLTGWDGNGRPVLTPEPFGTPVAVALETLHAEYRPAVKGDSLPVGPPASEQDVLRERDAESNRTLNQTYARAVLASEGRKPKPARPFTPPAGSPEDTFAKVAEDGS